MAIATGEIKAKAHLLYVRREHLTQPDYYGTRNFQKWEKEVQHFVATRVVPLLVQARMGDLTTKLHPLMVAEIENAALQPTTPPAVTRFSNPDVFTPDMDPFDYELHCAKLLAKAGWMTRSTPKTGDQGVDVLAERNGLTLVVQCKLYSSRVGNAAVQEVVAARAFHHADLALVVSNAGYTKSAQGLAGMTKVSLLHHSQLSTYSG